MNGPKREQGQIKTASFQERELWQALVGPVIVQGMTGRQGSFHTERMLEYGTKVVAGVTPGKGGSRHLGLPVFDTVHKAVAATGARASCIFVPPRFAPQAILEAAEAGIRLIVVITEGIPVLDMVRITHQLAQMAQPPMLIGPNCPGVIAPGHAKIGIMPAHVHRQGPIAVVSRSGTLTYEAVAQLSAEGLGQRICVGIGGDPIHGLGFEELLPIFEADGKVEGIVLIGEIGGEDEVEAARCIQAQISKPVVAFVAGQSAPPGRRMGHAGAVIGSGRETAQAKMEALAAAGAIVVDNPAFIGRAMRKALG